MRNHFKLSQELQLIQKAKEDRAIDIIPINGYFYQWTINDPKYRYLAESICRRMGGECHNQTGLWQSPFNPFDILKKDSPARSLFYSSFFDNLGDIKPFQVGQWLIDTFLIKNSGFPFDPSPVDVLIPYGGSGGLACAVLSKFPFSKFPGLNLDILESIPGQSHLLRRSGFSRVFEKSFLNHKSQKNYDLIVLVPSKKNYLDQLNLYQVTELKNVFKAFSRLKSNGKIIGIIPIRYLIKETESLKRFQNLIAAQGSITVIPDEYGQFLMAFEITKFKFTPRSRLQFNDQLVDLIIFQLIDQLDLNNIPNDRDEILRLIRDTCNSSLFTGSPIFFPELYLEHNRLLNQIIGSILIESES